MWIESVKLGWAKARAVAKRWGPQLKKIEPYFDSMIIEIETQFPGAKRGTEKLQAFKERIERIAHRLDLIRGSIEPFWPIIKPFVLVIVAKYNKKGWPK